MGWRQFYGLWLWRAFRHSIGPADLLASLIGSGVAVLAHFQPETGSALQPLLWQAPLWAAAAVVVLRLVLAPYWIWRGDQEELATLRRSTDAEQHRKDVRERLGKFLGESVAFSVRARDAAANPGLEEEAQAWFAGLQNYVRAELGQSYVEELKNGLDISRVKIAGEAACATGLHVVNIRLKELLARLP